MRPAASPVRTDPTVQVWHTTREAAAYLRMSTRQLLQYARDGRLRGEQPSGRNGSWRFHTEWLDEFLGKTSRLAG
jgi:excisionase family DNA binding protein